jgi:hypothetical protein
VDRRFGSAGNRNPKLHRSKVLPRIIAHSFHQTLCGQAPQDFANGNGPDAANGLGEGNQAGTS